MCELADVGAYPNSVAANVNDKQIGKLKETDNKYLKLILPPKHRNNDSEFGA
jgi:hypothetical protein